MLILRFLITILFIFTCSLSFAREHRSTLPQAQYVLPHVVREWESKRKKFIFVDVRETCEFKVGHLDGAINIPYLDVEKAAKTFDHHKPYVFYCTRSSWRAPYAANTMADLGFKNAYILQGGIAAWNAGGQVIYASNNDQKGIVAPYPEGLARILYHPKDNDHSQKLHLTRRDLRSFDGKDGHPAYVAVNGVIYDVTQSRLWRGGVHAPSEGNAMAGQDLTEIIKLSPHGDKHLKDFPIVGWLAN